jgi:hypothetical protein
MLRRSASQRREGNARRVCRQADGHQSSESARRSPVRPLGGLQERRGENAPTTLWRAWRGWYSVSGISPIVGFVTALSRMAGRPTKSTCKRPESDRRRLCRLRGMGGFTRLVVTWRLGRSASNADRAGDRARCWNSTAMKLKPQKNRAWLALEMHF